MDSRACWIAVCVLLLSVGLVATPVAGQPAGQPTEQPAGQQSTQSADRAVIGPAVEAAGGEQTVIVRLTEQPEATIRATSHESQVGRMQSHATTTQSPFERFATTTPGVEIDRSFWLINALVVSVDTNDVPLQRLGAVENVKQIHENYNLSVAATAATGPTAEPQPISPSPFARSAMSIQRSPPQQPSTAQLGPTTPTTDGLARINAPGAWAYTRGASTSIAVLDTGVDPTHPDIDLAPTNWKEWNAEGNPQTTVPQDYDGHGTHVSGIAAGGNASGTAIGVAPETELYHGAVLTDCGNTGGCGGTVAQLTAGMEWAVAQNVDVISMSLGGTARESIYLDPAIEAVRNANDAGSVVVAAAGNNGPGVTTSPGNVYGAISVGASSRDANIWDRSGGGIVRTDAWENPPSDWPATYSVPTVVAPGIGINSSVPGGGYGQRTGTSQATPHVAGTVALMRAVRPELSPERIESTLAATAVDVGAARTRQGAGRIDAAAAVAAVAPQVQLTNVALSPTTISETPANYTLTATATSVSDDDRPDTITVSLPPSLAIVDTKGVTVVDTAGRSVNVINTTVTNETDLRAVINPDTDAAVRDLTLTARFEARTANSNSHEPSPPDTKVRLTNVALSPTTISETPANYTLTATAANVSDDDRPDRVTVSLPPSLTIVDTNEFTAADAAGRSVNVINTTVTNETDLRAVINPDTDAAVRDLTLTARFEARTAG